MKKFRLFAVVLAVMIITIGSFIAAPYVDVSSLSTQQQMQVASIGKALSVGDYEVAYHNMILSGLPISVNEGIMNGSA